MKTFHEYLELAMSIEVGAKEEKVDMIINGKKYGLDFQDFITNPKYKASRDVLLAGAKSKGIKGTPDQMIIQAFGTKTNPADVNVSGSGAQNQKFDFDGPGVSNKEKKAASGIAKESLADTKKRSDATAEKNAERKGGTLYKLKDQV